MSQDGDFHKRMIKESMKPQMMLKSDSMMLFKNWNPELLKLETDPEKIAMPIHSSFNHRLDSFMNKVRESLILSEPQYVISPYALMPYTNEDLPIDFYYDDTPVYLNGKWYPTSALPGGNAGGGLLSIIQGGVAFSPVVIFQLLLQFGVIKNDPLPPTKSKKQKALEQIKKIYDMDEEENIENVNNIDQ